MNAGCHRVELFAREYGGNFVFPSRRRHTRFALVSWAREEVDQFPDLGQGTLPAQFPAGVKGEYFGFKRHTTDQYGHGIVYRPVSVGKSYERIPLRVSGEISKYVPNPGGKVDGGLEV